MSSPTSKQPAKSPPSHSAKSAEKAADEKAEVVLDEKRATKQQGKDSKPNGPEHGAEEADERDGDSDDFSDVVVIDSLGIEREKPIKATSDQPQNNNQQPEKPVEKPTEQEGQQKKTRMDPPQSANYPNLSEAGQQQQAQQQSWFSSSQLPYFLKQQPDDDQQSSTTPAASIPRLLGELRARLQPWGEFLKPAKFGLPPALIAVGPRVKYNLRHFLSNYLCLFLILLVYCIISSLLMLLTLIVLGGLCYTIYTRTQKGPIILGGNEIPPSLLYTLALMACIPLFYMANAGSLMYWVTGTGLFLMLAHAVFYASEEVPGQEFEVVTVVTA